MDGRTDRLMDGWLGGWMDVQRNPEGIVEHLERKKAKNILDHPKEIKVNQLENKRKIIHLGSIHLDLLCVFNNYLFWGGK